MGRADGRRIKTLPPFTKIIPYIMVDRVDATNYISIDFPYDKVNQYINQCKRKGNTEITMMACILAAFIRTIAKYPETNRFVIAKKIYARKGIWVSFVTLKDNWSGKGEPEETVVKLEFTGYETLTEVANAINNVVEKNRKHTSSNAMDKLVDKIFSIPIVPSAIVSFLKWLDRRGLLPLGILKASPFHTSIFFSNMASIRSYPIYHHIYNFGSTSVFIALGMDLSVRKKYMMNISTDERICNGATFVHAMRYFMKCLLHPEYLEEAPVSVNEDIK
ncbi:MAG: hypothetical protein LBC58_02135 [Clostridiales Family XIII bacterium]|jgi:hypothetical protein|nr:hypothetical protein [Clostridiales Family XIII bacterium]